MEKYCAKTVPVAHSNNKRQLTAVLAIIAAGEYLPPQLLYQEKTPKCHPHVSFPAGWNVWHSHNHWLNEITMKYCIDIIIVPFATRKRQELKLRFNHPTIVIFDDIHGQTTSDILSHLKSLNI